MEYTLIDKQNELKEDIKKGRKKEKADLISGSVNLSKQTLKNRYSELLLPSHEGRGLHAVLSINSNSSVPEICISKY